MADPVVHFELHVPDQAAAATFYSELFGWNTQTVPVPGSGDYTLVDTRAGSGINGGIGGSDDGRAWSTVYLEVLDVQAALDKVESLGGRVLLPASDRSALGLRTTATHALNNGGLKVSLIVADLTIPRRDASVFN